jgi:hypothetical protein
MTGRTTALVVARRLATRLGPGWEARSVWSAAEALLDSPDGLRCRVHADQQTGRARVELDIPRAFDLAKKHRGEVAAPIADLAALAGLIADELVPAWTGAAKEHAALSAQARTDLDAVAAQASRALGVDVDVIRDHEAQPDWVGLRWPTGAPSIAGGYVSVRTDGLGHVQVPSVTVTEIDMPSLLAALPALASCGIAAHDAPMANGGPMDSTTNPSANVTDDAPPKTVGDPQRRNTPQEAEGLDGMGTDALHAEMSKTVRGLSEGDLTRKIWERLDEILTAGGPENLPAPWDRNPFDEGSCMGHEKLDGIHRGEMVHCEGTCRST